MTMKNREVLEKKFSKKEVKSRPGPGGRTILYVETASVIRRLNEAFDGDWSFEIKDKYIDLQNGYVWILGRLVCGGIVKEQFGSKAISYNPDGSFADLGDDLKAAASDALKKCATLLGVGLYLYEGEESEETFAFRPATERQKSFIRDLLKSQGKTVDEELLSRLSSQEASQLIDTLRGETTKRL
jgi:DNA-binding MarR family transcriptional regulator